MDSPALEHNIVYIGIIKISTQLILVHVGVTYTRTLL